MRMMSSFPGRNEVACSALFASHVVRRIWSRRSPSPLVATIRLQAEGGAFIGLAFTLVCRSPARWGSVVCCMVRGGGGLIVRRRHSGLDRSAAAGMALLPEYGGARTACGEEAGRPIH